MNGEELPGPTKTKIVKKEESLNRRTNDHHRLLPSGEMTVIALYII